MITTEQESVRAAGPQDVEILRRLHALTSADPGEDCPGHDDPPADPPPAFPQQFHHVVQEIRKLASEISVISSQLPTLDAVEHFLAGVAVSQRADREQDLLYMLIGAQVTLEQAKNWLTRALGAGA